MLSMRRLIKAVSVLFLEVRAETFGLKTHHLTTHQLIELDKSLSQVEKMLSKHSAQVMGRRFGLMISYSFAVLQGLQC